MGIEGCFANTFWRSGHHNLHRGVPECIYIPLYVGFVAPPFSREIGFMTFGRTTRSLLGIKFFDLKSLHLVIKCIRTLGRICLEKLEFG